MQLIFTVVRMTQDRLFLIQPGFVRPNRDPSQRFVCPDCNVIEGLLASDPQRAARSLKVIRVPFERPRQQVVALIGLAHQELPTLILGKGSVPPADAKVFDDTYFLDTLESITRWLTQRHGFFSL